MNEHKKECYFNHRKASVHTIFLSSNPHVNLLTLLTALSDKMADGEAWLVRSPVNQAPCEGSIVCGIY